MILPLHFENEGRLSLRLPPFYEVLFNGINFLTKRQITQVNLPPLLLDVFVILPLFQDQHFWLI
jgi:hypothetical protein